MRALQVGSEPEAISRIGKCLETGAGGAGGPAGGFFVWAGFWVCAHAESAANDAALASTTQTVTFTRYKHLCISDLKTQRGEHQSSWPLASPLTAEPSAGQGLWHDAAACEMRPVPGFKVRTYNPGIKLERGRHAGNTRCILAADSRMQMHASIFGEVVRSVIVRRVNI